MRERGKWIFLSVQGVLAQRKPIYPYLDALGTKE
jgi:hypothetical protein